MATLLGILEWVTVVSGCYLGTTVYYLNSAFVYVQTALYRLTRKVRYGSRERTGE